LAPVFEKLYPYDKYRRAADALVDAKGDLMLGCRGFAAAQASAAHQPTYYYRFDYDDHLMSKILGAAHAFEIPFIFDSIDRPYFSLAYLMGKRKKTRPMVDAIMSYWTNFAKKGDPNGGGVLEWPRYEPEKRKRMILDLPQRVEMADNVEKCEFWETHGPNVK